jgi:hypothetical protein
VKRKEGKGGWSEKEGEGVRQREKKGEGAKERRRKERLILIGLYEHLLEKNKDQEEQIQEYFVDEDMLLGELDDVDQTDVPIAGEMSQQKPEEKSAENVGRRLAVCFFLHVGEDFLISDIFFGTWRVIFNSGQIFLFLAFLGSRPDGCAHRRRNVATKIGRKIRGKCRKNLLAFFGHGDFVQFSSYLLLPPTSSPQKRKNKKKNLSNYNASLSRKKFVNF